MDCSTKQRLYLYVIADFNKVDFRSNIVAIFCDAIRSLQSQLKDPRSLAVLPAIEAWERGECSDFKLYDICTSAYRAASELVGSKANFAALAVAHAADAITKIRDKIRVATYAAAFIDTVADGSAILDKHLCAR